MNLQPRLNTPRIFILSHLILISALLLHAYIRLGSLARLRACNVGQVGAANHVSINLKCICQSTLKV